MTRIVALDTETHLFPNYGKIRTGLMEPTLVCASFWGEDTEGFFLAASQRAELCGELTRLLESDTVLVGHNLGFDFCVLAREFEDIRQLFVRKCLRMEVLDTQTMHALLCPDWNAPRSLKRLIQEYFNRTMEKGAVRVSFRRETPLSEDQIKYAMEDARATHNLAQYFLKHRPGELSYVPGEWRQHHIRCEKTLSLDPIRLYSAAAVLAKLGVERRGFYVDRDALIKLHDEANTLVDDLMRKMVDHGLARPERDRGAPIETVNDPRPTDKRKWTWNGRDHMFRKVKGGSERSAVKFCLNISAIQAEYEEFARVEGIDAPRTPTDTISLEYDFWKQYRDDMPEWLQLHLAVGKQRKLLNAYFKPLLETLTARKCHKVYPSYGVGLAETGRWSCFKPNIQQQPKSIRHIYRPARGNVFVGADYKSLELYTLCHCMSAMGIQGELFKALSGGDVHLTTAALMYEVDPEEVTPEQRQAAKFCNFGLPGGLGPRTFAKNARQAGLGWDLETARSMRAAWLSAYPDVAEYMQKFQIHPLELRHYSQTRRQFLEYLGFDPRVWPSRWDIQDRMNQGKFYTCTLPSGRVVPNRRYSQAMNVFFQGCGADVITLAYLMVEEGGLQVVAVVHDSITVECEESQASDTARWLKVHMEEAQNRVCCLAPPATVEPEIKKEWF